jgi:hypothetical protein
MEKSVIGQQATIDKDKISFKGNSKALKDYKDKVLSIVNQAGEIEGETPFMYKIKFGKKSVTVPKKWVIVLSADSPPCSTFSTSTLEPATINEMEEFNWSDFEKKAYKEFTAFFKQHSPSIEVWKNLSLRDKDNNHVYACDKGADSVGGHVRKVGLEYRHGIMHRSIGYIFYDVKTDNFEYYFPSLNIDTRKPSPEYADGGLLDQARQSYFNGDYTKQDEYLDEYRKQRVGEIKADKELFDSLYNNPDVTVLTLSSKSTLSSQLQKITGHHWSTIDFDGSAELGTIITEKETGKKFTVINEKEADLLFKEGSFSAGGSVDSDMRNIYLSGTPLVNTELSFDIKKALTQVAMQKSGGATSNAMQNLAAAKQLMQKDLEFYKTVDKEDQEYWEKNKRIAAIYKFLNIELDDIEYLPVVENPKTALQYANDIVEANKQFVELDHQIAEKKKEIEKNKKNRDLKNKQKSLDALNRSSDLDRELDELENQKRSEILNSIRGFDGFSNTKRANGETISIHDLRMKATDPEWLAEFIKQENQSSSFAKGGTTDKMHSYLEGMGESIYEEIITSLIAQGYLKPNALFHGWSSGGGFEHFIIQRPDKKWLIADSLSELGVRLTDKEYKSGEDVYKAFWNENESGDYLSTKHISVDVEDLSKNRPVADIVKDITGEKWQTTFGDEFAKGGSIGNVKTEAIAKEFSRIVREDLTDDEIKEVVNTFLKQPIYTYGKNERPLKLYCPAHKNMQEAFKIVMHREPALEGFKDTKKKIQEVEADTKIMSDAWNLAHEKKFYPGQQFSEKIDKSKIGMDKGITIIPLGGKTYETRIYGKHNKKPTFILTKRYSPLEPELLDTKIYLDRLHADYKLDKLAKLDNPGWQKDSDDQMNRVRGFERHIDDEAAEKRKKSNKEKFSKGGKAGTRIPFPGYQAIDEYAVLNENTLGYTFTATNGSKMFGILHGSVLRGSSFGDLSGPISVDDRHKLRPATEKDFDEYRVSLPPDFKKMAEGGTILNSPKLNGSESELTEMEKSIIKRTQQRGIDVDPKRVKQLALKIAKYDKRTYEIIHFAEAMNYMISENDENYGEITSGDIEYWIKNPKYWPANLDRMTELKLLSDAQKKRLSKAREVFDKIAKMDSSSKNLLIAFDSRILSELNIFQRIDKLSEIMNRFEKKQENKKKSHKQVVDLADVLSGVSREVEKEQSINAPRKMSLMEIMAYNDMVGYISEENFKKKYANYDYNKFYDLAHKHDLKKIKMPIESFAEGPVIEDPDDSKRMIFKSKKHFEFIGDPKKGDNNEMKYLGEYKKPFPKNAFTDDYPGFTAEAAVYKEGDKYYWDY